MRRRLFGSILAAVALASTAAIPILASPAGAAVSCPQAGEFPNVQGAQSNLKVDCTTAAGDNATAVVIHDAVNAKWHSGAARQITITTEAVNSATIVASGLSASDVRRPISGFNTVAGACLNKPLFQGGTFITAVAGTTVTLSRNTPPTCTQNGGKALVEHTNNRVLTDASCTAGLSSTLTSSTGKFVASDIGKSVTGGPFKPGAKITATPSATTATVTSTSAPAACTAPDTITIGLQTCAAGAGCTPAPSLDPDTRELANQAGATAFTCSTSTLSVPASPGGGFKATNSDVGLQLVMTGSGAPVVKTITANTTTSATFTPTGCATGQTATLGTAVIGIANANAPKNGSAMMTLAAELNLSPLLVTTGDDCALNTFEGFEVLGQWQNPGAYTSAAVIGGTTAIPALSTGQVLFPTAVVSFQGFVGPAIGDVVQPGAHYNFSFPSLPTSLAVCQSGAPPAPSNGTALSFGIIPTPLASAPFLPTGSGNPGAAGVRSLDSRTGATMTIKIGVLKAGGLNLTGSPQTPPGCNIQANTVVPTFALTTCGDG
jgi:hypothetical protein